MTTKRCLRAQRRDLPQIFDYMNVQDVHNATYASTVPETLLKQARALANWEQYQVFSDPSFGGIGNSAYFHAHGVSIFAFTSRQSRSRHSSRALSALSTTSRTHQMASSWRTTP